MARTAKKYLEDERETEALTENYGNNNMTHRPECHSMSQVPNEQDPQAEKAVTKLRFKFSTRLEFPHFMILRAALYNLKFMKEEENQLGHLLNSHGMLLYVNKLHKLKNMECELKGHTD